LPLLALAVILQVGTFLLWFLEIMKAECTEGGDKLMTQRKPMMQLRHALGFSALVMFLAACGSTGIVEDTETVTVVLAAAPTQVDAAGGSVTLTATVTGDGAVAVDFAEKDAATALFTDSDGADGYTATVNVVPPKTYVAIAKDAAGKTIGSSNAVTVTATGTTPPPTDPNQPPPTPGPTPPNPNPVPTPGGPIPADAVLVTTAAEINAAVPGATIVLTQDLTCDVDPCITLKDNQRLLGGKDGQLLTEPGIKITTSIATDEITKSTVVTMANGSGVEGIEFLGDDIYQAIKAADTITGDVTIRNVAISAPTANNPIDMKSKGAVTIENLTFETTRAIFIEGFSAATLRGLNLTINRAAAATGAAFTVVAAQGAVVLESVNLTTNVGGVGKDGILIQSGILPTDAGAMTVTVKGSSVTFPAANLADSVAFNFNIVGTGTLAIQEAESTGNTTNSTYAFKATYDTGVTGKITLP
jgi:hypothetical protein